MGQFSFLLLFIYLYYSMSSGRNRAAKPFIFVIGGGVQAGLLSCFPRPHNMKGEEAAVKHKQAFVLYVDFSTSPCNQ